MNLARGTHVRGLALGALAWIAIAGLAPRAGAQVRWPDERTAGNFHCHADFSLARFDGLWSEMARLQQDLTRGLQVPAGAEHVHIFLFERRGTYEGYMRQHFPDVPARRAMYIKDQGPGMVFAHLSDELETDVRHESTHALLHAALPVVPLWLDEGLAEYYEVSPADRPHGHSHLDKVRWAAWLGQSPSLEELERIGGLEHMGPSQYRHAWSWVHFMLHGPPEAREELVGFLQAIHAHTPPGALSARLRGRIPDLDVRFRQHFRGWKQP